MSDDAPGLGGQRDDNSPMIGSVQTRAMVTARGAYTVGNLEALITLLGEQQKHDFKHVVVRYAWESIASVIDEVGPEDRFMPEVYEEVYTVQQWVEQPTADRLQVIVEALGRVNVISLHECMLNDLMFAAAAKPEDTPSKAAGAMADAHEWASAAHHTVFISIIRRWQLDAAWAILRGRDIPPYPVIDHQTVDALVSDLPQMYEARNLGAILLALDVRQEIRFRAIVCSQALTFVEEMLPHTAFQNPAREWFQTVTLWLDHPRQPRQREFASLLKATFDIEHRDDVYRALTNLVRLFGVISLSYEPRDNWSQVRGLNNMMGVVECYAWSLVNRGLSREHGDPVVNARHRTPEWILDTAWAILRDDPIPPLELTP